MERRRQTQGIVELGSPGQDGQGVRKREMDSSSTSALTSSVAPESRFLTPIRCRPLSSPTRQSLSTRPLPPPSSLPMLPSGQKAILLKAHIQLPGPSSCDVEEVGNTCTVHSSQKGFGIWGSPPCSSLPVMGSHGGLKREGRHLNCAGWVLRAEQLKGPLIAQGGGEMRATDVSSLHCKRRPRE